MKIGPPASFSKNLQHKHIIKCFEPKCGSNISKIEILKKQMLLK